MKLYCTVSTTDGFQAEAFNEYTSSASDASKARTRLKKLGHKNIETAEVEVPTTRAGLIRFLNNVSAHVSWVVEPVAQTPKD